ncbi:MAG: chromate transporter, partial [Pseudomonadota bacterium]
ANEPDGEASLSVARLGLAAAAVSLWVTFVPSFGFIFTGAPFIARLTAMPRLSGALTAITAAVVGVIASLSLWFALHVLFNRIDTVAAGPLGLFVPDVTSLDPVALVIGLGAGWLLLWRHWPILPVLGGAALASGAFSWLA